MALFEYKAIAASGELVEGRMEARDTEAVHGHLRGEGFLPVETRKASVQLRRAGFRSTRSSRKLGDIAVMTRELVILLAAGQTLEKSLHLMATVSAPEGLRPALTLVRDRLRSGSSLADAFDEAGGFPPLFPAMIRAGEAGGALEVVLAKLADLLERTVRLRQTLVSAMIYPAILTLVAILSTLLLLVGVVPQFASLFANAPHALPWSTRMVLAASDGLRHWGTTFLAVLLVLLLAVPPLVRRMNAEGWWDRLVLRLPLVGTLTIMAATARLTRTLGVLLKSGVTLPAALELVRGVIGNRALAGLIDAMGNGIREGRGLAASLPSDHPLPVLAVQLLRVGEQSGRLDEVLIHLSDIYDGKLDLALKRLMAVFEPLCVLFLSAVIGSIVISILLAVVSINDLAF